MLTILEQRSGGSGRETPSFIKAEHFLNTDTSGTIKRNNTATRTFAEDGGEIEGPERLTITGNKADEKTRTLTDPKTGMEEEEDEKIIPATKRRPEIDGREKLTEFRM